MKAPVNQKAVYQTYAMLFEQVSNDKIPLDKALIMSKMLDGQNKTYANELKRAMIEAGATLPAKIRTIEMKAFAEIPVEEDNNQLKIENGTQKEEIKDLEI